MILKKPYAFLIKHFRLIHALLTLFLLVINFRYARILTFFNSYINNNYTTKILSGLSHTYVPFYLYFMAFIIVVFSVGMVILFNHKKKPNKVYLFMGIYYLILFIGLFILAGIFNSFATTLLASTLSRQIRDILLILYIPQFIFIIIIALRAVGFNLKKFEFKSDLKELDYSAEDAEEFELNIQFDNLNVKKKTHRAKRELVYYFKENKFIILCVIGVCLVIGGIYIYKNTGANYDRHISTNREFFYNNLSTTINDSIITNTNYKGDIIDENYYVVVNVALNNTSGKTININYDNYKLDLGDNLINPKNSYASNFIDFGFDDIPNSISHNHKKNISLVYQISGNDINKPMKLSLYDGSVLKNNKYIPKYLYIKIHPNKIYKNTNISTYSINEKIVFSGSYLGNTSLIISDYQIVNKYLYKYKDCKNEVCNEYDDLITPISKNRLKNTLLIMKVNFNLDQSVNYAIKYSKLSTFAEKFFTISYKENNETKYAQIYNVTPKDATDFIALEIPKTLIDMEFNPVINVSNNTYIINLK